MEKEEEEEARTRMTSQGSNRTRTCVAGEGFREGVEGADLGVRC